MMVPGATPAVHWRNQKVPGEDSKESEHQLNKLIRKETGGAKRLKHHVGTWFKNVGITRGIYFGDG